MPELKSIEQLLDAVRATQQVVGGMRGPAGPEVERLARKLEVTAEILVKAAAGPAPAETAAASPG